MNDRRSLRLWTALLVLFSAGLGVAHANIIYVDADAAGANNGTSWADAYNFLQDALADANAAPKPVQIWIAQGTYRPDEDSLHPGGTGERTATFRLSNGVSLYGGYPAGAGGFMDRDPNAYETILSGDLAGNDLSVEDPCELPYEPSRAENCFNVVTAPDVNETAVIDSLTIMAGNAENRPADSWELSAGGGLNIRSGSPVIQRCVFRKNAASSYGGAISILNGGTATIRNCLFERNSTTAEGGALAAVNSGLNLTRCSFNDNKAAGHGGAVTLYGDSGSADLQDCLFTRNAAASAGGAVDLTSGAFLTAAKCRFLENSASSGGAISWGFDTRLTAKACDFIENHAENHGGALYNTITRGQGGATLADCVFLRNRANDGGAMFNWDASPTLRSCQFSQNSAFRGAGGAVYNLGSGGLLDVYSRPELRFCTFTDNHAELGGAVCNLEAMPSIVRCSFTANEGASEGGAIWDYKSETVVLNCLFAGNYCWQEGGGIFLWDSRAVINSTTMHGNLAYVGGAIFNLAGDLTVTNSILWDDSPHEIWMDYDSAASVSYSDVKGGWQGLGNIESDPCFVAPGYWDPGFVADEYWDDIWVTGDHHLKSQAGRWDADTLSWVKDQATSSCIDAGDPDASIGDELFPNGGCINIGAYAGTTEASKSYLGEPVCEKNVAGDINGDCRIDFADFAFIARRWLQESTP